MNSPYPSPQPTRRDFVKAVGIGAAAVTLADASASTGPTTLRVDPEPLHDLSPHLYMQFMEPLGTTDGSVAAGWSFARNHWRQDLVDATKALAPPMLRWGGCWASYYHWREAVGPRDKRVPVYNICWGGLDTSQIGTAEFVDFCRQTACEPLMCVNFESDGKPYFANCPTGSNRFGDAKEAADWVSYCNDPDNAERKAHGHKDPLTIKWWQLGNETSYGSEWDGEICGRKTVEFAKAMRARDPDLTFIGWGDRDYQGNFWAERVLEIAGEHIEYIAFHNMFDPGAGDPDFPLKGNEYRKDPARTWDALMNSWKGHDRLIREMRQRTDAYDVPLALTECHFAIPGRNRCEVLSSWAAGVAYARFANLHERNGDKLKIATLADFCGTRWQVNAIMIPVPGGPSFLLPVALVMSLYRHHSGENAVTVAAAPADLDVTASRTGDRVYLHVVNTNRTRSVAADLGVQGKSIRSGRVFELAQDPTFEVIEMTVEELQVKEKSLPTDGLWTFPAASVSAVELDLA
jgi:alpha-N-arabinofuranosidase